MSLRAILFDFNGVIINDESIHRQLILQLLLEENLRISEATYQRCCIGRSDRVALINLLSSQERSVSETRLQQLIHRKATLYHQALQETQPLPIYPGVTEWILHLAAMDLKLAVVSGAVRSEIEWVLEQAKVRSHFSAVVAGDEILTSKPDPEGYLLAIDRLNQADPSLNLKPGECLALEDTPAGIQAAKQAGISVVGVANTYPFRMMHRQANWVVDHVQDLDFEHLQRYFNCDRTPTSGANP